MSVMTWRDQVQQKLLNMCRFLSDLTFDAHSCHMDTAIKHPVPDRVKQSFVIFDIRAL